MTTSRPLPEPDAEPEQPRLLSRPSRLRPAVWRILGAVVGAVILGGAAVSIPYPAALASLAISLFLSGALLTKRGLLRPRRARNFSAAPRWVLIAGATALGLTFVQVLRFPADLTPGDGLLIAVTVFIGAESPRLLASAARRIPAWFWTAAILISASALLTLLRPETGVQASLVPAAKTIAAMVLVPLIVVAIGSSHRRVKWLASGWVAGATVSALASIPQQLGLWHNASLFGVADFGLRAFGLSNHPNHLGIGSALALPVCIALAVDASASLQRWIWSVGGAALVLGVAASGSRAAIIGTALGSLSLGWIVTRYRSTALSVKNAAIAAVALSVVVGSTWFLLPSIDRHAVRNFPILSARLWDSSGLRASDQGRLVLYESGLETVPEFWLIGRGFEDETRDHNVFLQWLLSGGVVGLAGFLTYLVGGLAAGWNAGRTHHNLLATACLVAFGLWAVMGLFQPNIRDRYLFVPVGILLASLNLTRGEENATRS